MIDWLEIRQFAIAEQVDLEFGDSFTTVTGETGSGKSLIVDAIGILLGNRCENSLIRPQQEQAEIHGGFKLDAEHPAMRWLRDNALDTDDECILRRVVRRDKPSRAFINGRAVNASQMREIGRELVDIHSQNEHHFLLRRKGQLALLDNAAGNNEQVAQLEDCYEKLSEVGHHIERLQSHRSVAKERAKLLEFQLEELNALQPQKDEWQQLEEQHKRMNHAKDLSDTMLSVTASLSGGANELSETAGENNSGGGRDVSTSLSDCAQQIQGLVEFDPRLKKIVEMLEAAQVNVAESVSLLKTWYADNTFSREEMEEIESRFSQYHELSRKHNTLPGLLAERLGQIQVELTEIQNPEAELKRLEEEWQEHNANYEKLAKDISEKRNQATPELSSAVTGLMQELGMEGGVFEIHLQPSSEPITRYGTENVEFLVSANPGQPPQPLTKVASGGELSRISLAINVVLAADAPDSTLILDEVDVGIGGKIAEVVGQKLKQIGKNRQIICITHLSQVAAKAQHHWSVVKLTDQNTNVEVKSLDPKQRIEEIARMTAGAELTPQSLAHAEQMLQSA